MCSTRVAGYLAERSSQYSLGEHSNTTAVLSNRTPVVCCLKPARSQTVSFITITLPGLCCPVHSFALFCTQFAVVVAQSLKVRWFIYQFASCTCCCSFVVDRLRCGASQPVRELWSFKPCLFISSRFSSQVIGWMSCSRVSCYGIAHAMFGYWSVEGLELLQKLCVK